MGHTSSTDNPPFLTYADAQLWLERHRMEPGFNVKAESFIARFNNTDTAEWADGPAPTVPGPDGDYTTKEAFINELREYARGVRSNKTLNVVGNKLADSQPQNWDDSDEHYGL